MTKQEFFIKYRSRWHIANVARIGNEGWWCERDGSRICSLSDGVEVALVLEVAAPYLMTLWRETLNIMMKKRV